MSSRSIDAIEQRTGAEVAVYSQVVDYGVTEDETEARARALIDQWGIGRAGFDDGLVIFFDLDPSLEHGQVQLYAAPGFEATFLDNAARQRIFDEDMLPHLQSADLDAALAAAMTRVDEAATAENAARLQAGRQVNAVLGLIMAPVVFMGLAGWAFFSWRRFGKDPVYLDDPSILMPAPPEDLTAASGAFVIDGGTSRRALTTAMLDLASRGLIAFREEKGLLGLSTKVGVETQPDAGDAVEEAQRTRNARRPTGPAEAVALQRLRGLDGTEHYIEPDDLPKFGAAVDDFDRALESHVVAKGWLVEKPSKVVSRWVGRGVVAIILGVVADLHRAQHADLRARARRWRGHRRRRRDLPVRPGHAVGDDAGRDDPGDARGVSADAAEDDGAGSLDAAGRRRRRACRGSRRPTRPSCGARRWACSTRSRRCSTARWRMSRPAAPGCSRPTSRSGTTARMVSPSRAPRRPAAAARSSPARRCPTSAG